ncbi:Crp/Fnr family transcriptional regulator [Clostridiales Family XIII bacterium ASD5510]|uniref:Crp/Fnr family transcriptional regulator n=1 Tax=Hominibacterium faecale TaxID=2839743 RepID=A0A9J6QWH6_9FIRM|nr:Crp/Fnr family transcriptional regulator [Hominibacterium faecale]MCU7379814.1 Crp/Fnr family transcriptional regulator [Hominibacterium faecale]
MKRYFISDGIAEDSIKKMLRCFRPQLKRFQSGETIMRYSDRVEKVGLMMKGTAVLHVLDADGNAGLLETYEQQDLFGELFHLPLDGFEYLVEAKTDSQVLFIDYTHIITPCEKTCAHHSQLINNLFLMAAQRAQALSLHLNILHQPTIRKKLLTYLTCLRGTLESRPITIPMTLSALAEYLCVDRSAMTREIRLMNEEGILQSHRRTFQLL